MAQDEMRAAVAELGLTMDAVFVPFSKSRNAASKDPSLNWKITIKRNGREVLTTDYMQGSGHCPAYKTPDRYAKARMIAYECEHGVSAWLAPSSDTVLGRRGKPILPEIGDVFYSLVIDAGAIDHATFEDWASDFGYDTDSRSAEATYRACLEIALKLRAALGDDGLNKLREAAQDY